MTNISDDVQSTSTNTSLSTSQPEASVPQSHDSSHPSASSSGGFNYPKTEGKRDRVNFQVSNLTAGFCAGFVSTVVGFPIDAFRVRLLFGTPHNNISSGIIFSTCFSTVKSGLVWPLQKAIEQKLKEHNETAPRRLDDNSKSSFVLPPIPPLMTTVLSGLIGNTLPGLLLNPLNVIKVRYMENEKRKNISQIFRAMYESDGISVFKKGVIATVVRDCVWGVCYFPIFSLVRESLQQQSSSSPSSPSSFSLTEGGQQYELRNFLLASVTAAVIATLFSSPFDGARLFELQSQQQAGELHTFLSGLTRAVQPTRANVFSILTGLTRVTTTTITGHLIFLSLVNWNEQRNNSTAISDNDVQQEVSRHQQQEKVK